MPRTLSRLLGEPYFGGRRQLLLITITSSTTAGVSSLRDSQQTSGNVKTMLTPFSVGEGTAHCQCVQNKPSTKHLCADFVTFTAFVEICRILR
jgi:hypothetical protein